MHFSQYARYALAKGAEAFAIDIEEAGHRDGSRDTKTSHKVLKRTVQRRSGVKILDEEPAGIFWITCLIHFFLKAD